MNTATASTSPAAAPAKRFSRPRFAAIVALGVYPLVTALIYIVFPLTDGWAVWQRTLLIVPMMVVMMIWGLIPAVHRYFHAFVNPVRG